MSGMEKAVTTTIETTIGEVEPKIIYAPLPMEGLDAYIGIIIVSAIVFVYFSGMCVLSVYFSQQKIKKAKR